MSTEAKPNEGDPTFQLCYHFTSTHFSLGEFSSAWYILNCAVNALFSFVATMANIVVLVAIRRTPSLHSPSNTLLFGLAASDLGVGLIVHPLFFAHILAKVVRNKAVFCEAGIAVEVTANALCIISLLTVTAVGVDRFLALRLHLRYKELITVRRVTVAIGTVWIAGGFLGSFWLWKPEMVKINVTTTIITCLCASSFSYLQIYRVASHHRQILFTLQRAAEQPVQAPSVSRTDVSLANFKSHAIGTLWVCCLLFACYLPYLCVAASIQFTRLTESRRFLYEVTATVVFTNSSLNPIVYCWRLRDIRIAVKKTLRWFWHKL